MPAGVAVVLALTLALWGCSERAAAVLCGDRPIDVVAGCPKPQATDGCRVSVAVSVSTGLTPRIAWAPGCGINHLVVHEGDEFLQGRLVWSFSAPIGVLVRSEVTYGVLPAGTILEGPTLPLESGKSYRVKLETLGEGGDITGQGAATFQP